MKRIMLALAMVLGLSYSLLAANAENTKTNGQPMATSVAVESTNGQSHPSSDSAQKDDSAKSVKEEMDINFDHLRNKDAADSFVRILAVSFIFGGPILIVVLCCYYRYRIRVNRLYLAKQALEAGKELPVDILNPTLAQTGEQRIQKGVRTLFVGLGLTIVFRMLISSEIMSIGILIMCMGAGQIVSGCIKRRFAKDETQEAKRPVTTDNVTEDIHTNENK